MSTLTIKKLSDIITLNYEGELSSSLSLIIDHVEQIVNGDEFKKKLLSSKFDFHIYFVNVMSECVMKESNSCDCELVYSCIDANLNCVFAITEKSTQKSHKTTFQIIKNINGTYTINASGKYFDKSNDVLANLRMVKHSN